MKNIVILTGAGISAESGMGTFRDEGGLWTQYAIEDVATPEGFARNPALVQEFYNIRRVKAAEAKPNIQYFWTPRVRPMFHFRSHSSIAFQLLGRRRTRVSESYRDRGFEPAAAHIPST